MSCFSPDPSLTSRNVLRAVQGNMHVFEAPLQVKMKLQQNMEGLVNYFLQTHPYASWEWLGGKLLYLEQDKSVQYVKSHIKPDEGMYVGTSINKNFGK